MYSGAKKNGVMGGRQMTQIFLVRHGETVWNTQCRIQGHLDSPLTRTGLSQAKALAKHFKSQKFAALYGSDLGRAYETARCISEKNGLPIVIDQRLRERNFGIFQGVIKNDLKTKFPEAFRYYQANDADYVIEEGESLKQLSKRCLDCFEELVQKHVDERILIVTHSGVLVSLFKHTLNIPLDAPRRFLSSNCGINVFYYQDKTWLLERLGDLSHLHGVKSIDDSSL
ncbi:MAG TPA: histidine phosphatase family protein [Thioploca sp.]|nr:histidine phosphatase family protein [Thioploca sp.]